MRLTELTDGLHGYLRFETDVPDRRIQHRRRRPGGVRAGGHAVSTRSTTSRTGRLLLQSSGFAPMGLSPHAGEVRAFRAQLQPFDIADAVRTRAHLQQRDSRPAAAASICVQVGVSLDDDGRRAEPLSRSAAVAPACRARWSAASRRGGSSRLRAAAADASSPAPRARSTCGTLERRVPDARRARRARRRGARPSTTRSPGSSTRSARCGSSAPRWHTSCARRSRRCAARSSWRCEHRAATTAEQRDAGQPDRGARSADAADRPDPHAGPRRVRARSA